MEPSSDLATDSESESASDAELDSVSDSETDSNDQLRVELGDQFEVESMDGLGAGLGRVGVNSEFGFTSDRQPNSESNSAKEWRAST